MYDKVCDKEVKIDQNEEEISYVIKMKKEIP